MSENWGEGFIAASWERREECTDYQVVVCAAIRSSEGYIICGVRHYDYLMREQLANSLQDWEGTVEQGFMDQRGKFLTREDAFVVAKSRGQIVKRCGGDKDRLFSENLY